MKHSRRHRGNAGASKRVSFARHPLAAALAAAFVAASGSAWAELPGGAAVVSGTAGIATSGNAMTITNSPSAIVNWKTFSIGTQNSVHFQQQNAASQVLNRVVGNDPSSILGSLSSNGGVWLVNPHGVLFGANARIDVGGLVASTLAISNSDFLGGRFNFEAVNPLGGQVLNQGEINTTFGGRVWLMGDSVRNEGLIRTPGGNVVLAAGKSIELVDSGMPNVTVRVTAPENEALNLGTLIASAGSIDLHGGIVNQQGIVRADSVGTDAAGRVVIKAQGDVKLGDASITSASGSGSGAAGTLLAQSAAGTTSVTGEALATSGEGKGGHIQLLGKNVGLLNQAAVDASGAAGGGEVLVGGDYQGKNPAVANATATYLGPDASVKANATQAGDGGKVIVWGNDAARVYGTIEARGGPQAGNGGFVETSGGYLDAQPRLVDAGAAQGAAGTWLLDPSNITITGAGGNDSFGYSENGNVDPYQITSVSDGSRVPYYLIENLLDRGTNVEVRTGEPCATCRPSFQLGDILVQGSIVSSSASTRSLTLRAHNNITVEPGVSIRSIRGSMPVTFIADSDNDESGGILLQHSTELPQPTTVGGATISTNGGNIRMSGSAFAQRSFVIGSDLPILLRGPGIAIDGGTLDAGSGSISLTGGTPSGFGVYIRGALADPQVRSTLRGSNIAIQGGGTGQFTSVSIASSDITATSSISVAGSVTELLPGSRLDGGSISIVSDDLTLNQAVLRATGSLSIDSSFAELLAGSSIQGGDVSISASAFESTGSQIVAGAAPLPTPGPTPAPTPAPAPAGSGNLTISADAMLLDNSSLQAQGSLSLSGSSIEVLGGSQLEAAGRMSVFSDGDTVLDNARLASTATGDSITVVTNSFSNSGSTLSAPNGRWLIYAGPGQLPTFTTDFAGLDYAFIQVNAPFATKPARSGIGENGVLLADPLNVQVKVNATRPYDRGVLATFNDFLSYTAPAGFALETLTTSGNVQGTFDNKNAGVDKPIAFTGQKFLVTTAADTPVFGNTFSYTGDITPLAITAAGITAANKVYDATRTATLAGGSLSGVLAGDTVTLNGATGLFDDKNVGTGKTVTVAGGALAGPDAANYTLTGAATTTANITPRLIAPPTALDKVYDGNRSATLVAAPGQVLPGDNVGFEGLTGTFDTKNVGIDKTVTISGAPTGVDARNYTFNNSATTADITPKPVNITIAGSATGTGTIAKEYDATTAASLAATQFSLEGVVAGDAISVRGPVQGTYDSADVGTGKLVTVSGPFEISGADAPNYSIGSARLTNATSNILSLTASRNIGTITPATLTYNADPLVRPLGLPTPGLTGTVSGFKGADNLSTATSGSLAWLTPATVESPPGAYAVTGTGLSARNYVFTQASGNASALVVIAGNNPDAPQQQAVESSTSAVDSAIRSVVAAIGPRGSGGGGVFDISNPAVQRSFGPINIASMSQDELARLLEARKDFKRKLFAEAIYKLEIDPSLADVQPCANVADAASGLCRITTAQLEEVHARKAQAQPAPRSERARTASLPQIERKIAVLFGTNDYEDKKIPRLENAVPDVEAVSKVFAEKLGYEVRVVRNPKKADIIRTLNQLSTEVNSSDSVVVYYAGHGYSLEKNGAGYWLPSDAPVSDPSGWVSNNDVAKLLAGIRSKQMALISDSCYSGAFARDGMASVGRGVTAEDVLTKRSVVVLSSGGDEPVSDEGKDGHSIFAWNLMKAVGSVQNWRPGSTIFEEVQIAVKKEFPQTPKYGSVTSAGHQPGGDYLFELR